MDIETIFKNNYIKKECTIEYHDYKLFIVPDENNKPWLPAKIIAEIVGYVNQKKSCL